ncbi:MAG: SCO family protein [Deltaproteobacteria bacterium]|nr:SCO family protein [Deltaproteobacteria bacterium]
MNTLNTRIILTFICLFFLGASYTIAQEEKNTPDDGEQGKIFIEEQTGALLPLKSQFFDESGNAVTLGELIDKPTVLLPNYFYCPNSCSFNLANLASAVNRMKMTAGKDYRLIALSFNDKDTPADARDAKQNYIKLLYDEFPTDQWSFVTGTKENISAVLDTIGYAFKPVEDGTFIHPSALVTIAEDGKIIKYVYGSFIPGDVEMALSEATKGKPAISVKRLLNYCFNYDPEKNKTFFQTTKIVALLVFGSLIAFFFLKILRRKDAGDTSGTTH